MKHLVEVEPQEPLAALADVFHVPEAAAAGLDQRLGELPNLIGDLHGNASFLPGTGAEFQKKREGKTPLLVKSTIDCPYYNTEIPGMQELFETFSPKIGLFSPRRRTFVRCSGMCEKSRGEARLARRRTCRPYRLSLKW